MNETIEDARATLKTSLLYAMLDRSLYPSSEDLDGIIEWIARPETRWSLAMLATESEEITR